MALLHLEILGGFEARLASGKTVAIPSRKARALLAYLAFNAGAASARLKLAGLLWGDDSDTRAQNSLRQTLSALRRALGPIHDQILCADRLSISLDPRNIEVDAVDFQGFVARDTPADLEAAVSIYRGDLLDGLEVDDAGFQTWLEDERRRLRNVMARALNALMECKRADGATQDAIDLGQRLLTLDPLQENIHRTLMILYMELGHRQAALQQFHHCRELLASELGVDPEAETEAVYETLRNNHTVHRDAIDISDATSVGRSADDSSAGTPVVHGIERRPLQLSGVLLKPWRWAAATGLALAIGAVVILGWLQPWVPSFQPALQDRMAFPLPDKPSLAVLPFDNQTGNPKQESLIDGITDDLIRELARLDVVFIVSRNSTFAYRGQNVEIRQVAQDLGVHYVLQGSVLQEDGRIRINVQLADARSGTYVWSEHYDGPLTEIFALQDKVAQRVAYSLAGQMASERWMHQARKETSSVKAYKAFLRAKTLSRLPNGLTIENMALRIPHLIEALKHDPNYARARAQLAGAYLEIGMQRWGGKFGMTRVEAYKKGLHHLELAKQHPTREYHFFLSKYYWRKGRHDLALAEARKIVALNRYDTLGYSALAKPLTSTGRWSEAIEVMNFALRLDPLGDRQGWISLRLGLAYFYTGRYAEAAEVLERSAERNQFWKSYQFLAAAYAELGRLVEAREMFQRANFRREATGNKPITGARFKKRGRRNQRERERLRDALYKAGMPE